MRKLEQLSVIFDHCMRLARSPVSEVRFVRSSFSMVDTRRDREPNMIPVKQPALRGAASKSKHMRRNLVGKNVTKSVLVARPSRVISPGQCVRTGNNTAGFSIAFIFGSTGCNTVKKCDRNSANKLSRLV